MNFDYNEEQQLLADSVRRFLAKDDDFEARRRIVASEQGWSPAAWATFAQMGLTGLPFSADYGGFGGGAVDLMGVMEAFGEALVVEPYLPTLMGGQIVARSPLAGSILPAVVEGKMKLAFAHAEKGARYDLSAVKTQAKKMARCGPSKARKRPCSARRWPSGWWFRQKPPMAFLSFWRKGRT